MPRHDRGAGCGDRRADDLRVVAGPASPQARAARSHGLGGSPAAHRHARRGGGFGPKGSFYAEYGALAAAALSLHRPIKWIEDRRENFLSTQQERDQYWDVEIAVDGEARILGLRGTMV